MQRDLEAPLVRDMIEITTRLVGPPQDQPARWLRAGSAPSYSLQAVDAKLSAGSGQWRVLPGLGGRPAGGKLAGAVALSRIIARRPCTCPPLRWISDANSLRFDAPC